ncbi:CGNR zinc finger domain-containing protein [Nocardioides panzhihuensis]|uniref:Putative RNA-binding Zn ribbon-like protein n=1 Tax=Nocardioides panzhihuensis TaxID=860243 RepID=A0A7Z0DNP3_9ACTN|nr:CGNR zinc finger domain-containing protein [Nocardioides panzhihuensis]NYI78970.1 putative RNA-binding Zn ribbon-like protein [Nocardioides panzhihuensis]
MVFTYDTDMGLQAVVDLVNTDGSSSDDLTEVAQLDAFYQRWGYTGRHDRTRAELEDVRRIRPVMRELLLADRDEAVHLVNKLLSDYGTTPQLVRHDETDWHIHASAEDRPYAERIIVETAMAMVDVIRTDELSRLSICADEGCEGVVVDLSRNRSKRYCSQTCTNRNAVAAYRERQGSARK